MMNTRRSPGMQNISCYEIKKLINIRDTIYSDSSKF